jgi:coenzyme F420-reducing hydrogenase delta subunit
MVAAMSDDPFSARTEDYLNKALKVGVGSLPVVGGGLAEFCNYIFGDPAQERRDDFMRDVLRRIITLEKIHERLHAKALRRNEQFQATFADAVRMAIVTVSVEKKQMLRNAIINTGIEQWDENLRLKMIGILDRITPAHVSLLSQIAIGPRLIGTYVTDLEPQQFEFRHALLTDMYSMSLIRNNSGMIGEQRNQMVTANDGLMLRTTILGAQFLRFVSGADESPPA